MEFYKYVGGSFKSMVHPDDIQRVERGIANQIQISEAPLDRVEYRILRKDSAIRMVDDIGRKVFTENGSSVFYVCIVDVMDNTKKTKRSFDEPFRWKAGNDHPRKAKKQKPEI